jgi:hypothetical protein
VAPAFISTYAGAVSRMGDKVLRDPMVIAAAAVALLLAAIFAYAYFGTKEPLILPQNPPAKSGSAR